MAQLSYEDAAFQVELAQAQDLAVAPVAPTGAQCSAAHSTDSQHGWHGQQRWSFATSASFCSMAMR